MLMVDDVVFVFGVNGKVGQVVIQFVIVCGVIVIGVECGFGVYCGYVLGDVFMIDVLSWMVVDVVCKLIGGYGVDIVYNMVGSLYFEVVNVLMVIGV